uniref:Uncharacterized protein n=1 Tax=Sphenodon punctatus TaxID=8508 RepID=A0A8D0HQE6_SPHPU
MGNSWAQWCCGLFLRRGAGRLQRGGGSKYFRTCSTGEHFTIEVCQLFNLMKMFKLLMAFAK